VASTTPPTQAGYYWAVAVFDGSTNYAYTYAHTTFTITQAMPSVSVTAVGGMYNGNAYSANATVTGINGVPTTSLDGVPVTIIYYLNGQASTTAPTQAGFYWAVAVFNGSTNYLPTYTHTTFTLTQATPSISISATGGTYNGNSFAASATVTGISGVPTTGLDGVPVTIIYYLNGQASTTAPTQAGYYWAVAIFNGSTNYTATYTHTTFTIAQALPTLSITDASGAYTGNGFADTTGVNGSPTTSLEGVTLQVIYYQNGQAFETPPTHAGTYWAVVVFDGSTDYADTYTHTVFTITQAAVTLTIGNDSQIIGTPANLAQDLGSTINTGIAGQNFGINYTSPGDTTTAALGQYPIYGTVSSGTGLLSDYQVTLNPGTLTVNPKSKTFVVTSALDTPQAGLLTLRQAIAEANSDTTIDQITFGLNFPTTIVLTQGDLVVNHSVHIVGPGASSLTVSGNKSSRIFNIDTGNSVTDNSLLVSITGLTLSNGSSVGTTSGTGVGADYSGEGGAIYNHGQLTLTNDAISGSTVSGNSASGYGGAIFNAGSVVSSGTVYSGNSASFGGAVDNDTGAVFVSTNDTFWGNTAYYGGAFKNLGQLTTTDDTLTANNALIYGGGVFDTGTWNALNTIVAGNLLNTTGKSEIYLDVAGTINASHTLVGDAGTSGGIQNGVNGNIVGKSTSSIFVIDSTGKPLLANNGGPTPTVPLAANSPALGMGAALATLSTLTSTATNFTVTDATYLAVGDLLQIGTEVVKVTSITGSASTGYTVTILRNQGGTSFSTTTATAITLATDERGMTRMTNDLGAY
jgi:hypothetical protein